MGRSGDPSARIQADLEDGFLRLTQLLEQGERSETDVIVDSLFHRAEQYEEILALLERERKLSSPHLEVRRAFLLSARQFLAEVQSQSKVASRYKKKMTSGSSGYHYSRLADNDYEASSSSDNNFQNLLEKQEGIVRQQDEDLDMLGQSMSTLKQMSSQIGVELEQQSTMLDDLGHDMERVDTKLDGVMKKIARITNLDDDKRQCKAIVILSIILFFLIFILIVL